MDVIVQSTLSHSPGELVIPTSSDQTVDSVLATFCANRGIRQQAYYVLRTGAQLELDGQKRLDHYEISDGDTLLLGVKSYSDDVGCGINQWWVLALAALVIGTAGIVAIALLRSNDNKPDYQYGVVVDAGSTSSRVFVYRWDGAKLNDTAVARQIFGDCKATPAIADFESNPEAAGDSLKPCLDKAKRQIPSTKRPTTPLFFGATAGMRLLEAANPNATNAILASVRTTLSAYGLNFTDSVRQARIITGKEEGSFGWITANYLAGSFGDFRSLSVMMGRKQPTTFGALDLGGASTQITFVPEDPIPQDLQPQYAEHMNLYDIPYEVYTHSFLCYGNNEARIQFMANLIVSNNFSLLVDNPCLPLGNTTHMSHQQIFQAPCSDKKDIHPESNNTYALRGTSNSDQCHELTQKVFNFTGCLPSNCSFNHVYQPKVYGEFKAFSGFYYTTSFLNLTGKFSLEEFQNATNNFCSLNWTEITAMSHDPDDLDYLTTYCFGAHYMEILLHDGYKFDNETWETISFQGKVAGSDLGWSLGFMLNSSTTMQPLLQHSTISIPIFILLIIIFIGFLFFAVLFACQARKSPNRKYQQLSTYGSV